MRRETDYPGRTQSIEATSGTGTDTWSTWRSEYDGDGKSTHFSSYFLENCRFQQQYRNRFFFQ